MRENCRGRDEPERGHERSKAAALPRVAGKNGSDGDGGCFDHAVTEPVSPQESKARDADHVQPQQGQDHAVARLPHLFGQSLTLGQSLPHRSHYTCGELVASISRDTEGHTSTRLL